MSAKCQRKNSRGVHCMLLFGMYWIFHFAYLLKNNQATLIVTIPASIEKVLYRAASLEGPASMALGIMVALALRTRDGGLEIFDH